MKKLAMIAATAAAVLLTSAGVADASSPYPPAAPTVSVDSSTPAAGGTVTVTVSGCTAGDEVTFELEGDSKVVACDASGVASAELKVPTTAGNYSGTVSVGDEVELSFDIMVSVPDATLPETGNDRANTTGLVAVGFLVLGAGLVLGARRRSATA